LGCGSGRVMRRRIWSEMRGEEDAWVRGCWRAFVAIVGPCIDRLLGVW
jgi:hypothetical protein